MNLNRHYGGRRAKISGDEFQTFLENHSNQKIVVQRIPNGAEVKRCGKFLKTILVKSPYDFVIFSNGKTVACDAKSIQANTFPKSAIDNDQMMNLLKCENHVHRSGYLIYFRTENRICFFSATSLLDLKHRDSLKSNEGLFLGTRFTLDLGILFDERKSI